MISKRGRFIEYLCLNFINSRGYNIHKSFEEKLLNKEWREHLVKNGRVFSKTGNGFFGINVVCSRVQLEKYLNIIYEQLAK